MKNILVIGGGVAGMEASARLSDMGFSVSIVEQSAQLGGKLNRWDRLFPNGRPAKDLLQAMRVGAHSQSFLQTEVVSVRKSDQRFDVTLSDGKQLHADAVLVSTGFEVFDAHRKEEYGYGIYDNVITSADLEQLFRNGETLKTASGETPKRIGMVHCVGSRDEKAGHSYCSQVCCITAVKQAIEIREQLPDSEVFCFYMDLRMFGRHFEDIYREAQVKHGIQFIRGRLSESFENPNGKVMLKVEDTLLGKPLKMNVDMVVLMAGMVPAASTEKLQKMLAIPSCSDGFISSLDVHDGSSKTNQAGVFIAGACSGPKTMENTIHEAHSAAIQIAEYLRS